MSDLWFPGTDRSRPAPSDGGSILDGPPKCLWHDTETNGLPAYSTGYFPNMTLDPRTGHTWQHIPANRAARALRNPAGGVQTNRANVFQVEVIGWVNKIPFHPVMAEVARWLHEVRGTPLRATVDWLPYDASYGNSRVRLSGAAWNSYSGHLGHMHAPENDHGDPGWPFPINQILAHDQEAPDMTDAEHDALMWLRHNAVTLRDEGVCMTAMGEKDGPSGRDVNNLANVLAQIAEVQAQLVNGLAATGARLDAIEELLTPAEPTP